jgi:histidinol-phosphatase
VPVRSAGDGSVIGGQGPFAFGPEVSAGRRRGSPAELERWLAFAHACANEADAMAMAAFRRDLHITTKPDRTLVTDADRAIEVHLRERIADELPGHGVLGEEFGVSQPDASVRWYLDPIDGTHNFVRGIPVWAALIAVERDGELQAGVISAPALGCRWWASRGAGSWATAPGDAPGTPRRIRTSWVATLAASQLLTSSAATAASSGLVPGLSALLGRVWRERGFGDFWGYGLVAEGAAEAMVEIGPLAWDLAAPTVVLEEAGGVSTDLAGTRSIHSGNALASNGILHAELLSALSETRG